MISQLSLFLHPALYRWEAKAYRRLVYTLQLVLTQAGFSFRRQSSSQGADIAIVPADSEIAAGARITLCVEPANWLYPWTYKLIGKPQPDNLHGLWLLPFSPDLLSDNGGIELAENRLICKHDFLFDAFWWVAGVWETEVSRNRHGWIDPGGMIGPSEFQLEAPVSRVIQWLQCILLAAGVVIPPAPLWPEGKRFAVTFSHDVDYPEVIRWLEPARVLARCGLGSWRPALEVFLGKRHHWHFRSWMELEMRYGVRSAFYFIPRQGSLLEFLGSRVGYGSPDSFYDIAAPQFRRIINELSQAGFEVGLQASYNAYNSLEAFQNDMQRLASILGSLPAGNRHHYWHLNPSDPNQTLLLHERCGLTYDTSLAFERFNGWRRGIATPFFPWNEEVGRELRVLQIQTVLMDDHLFSYADMNGGAHNRKERVRMLLDQAAALNGCLLADMHEYVFDNELFPEWRSTFEFLIQEAIARSDAYIATPGQVAAWWRERNKAILALSDPLLTI